MKRVKGCLPSTRMHSTDLPPSFCSLSCLFRHPSSPAVVTLFRSVLPPFRGAWHLQIALSVMFRVRTPIPAHVGCSPKSNCRRSTGIAPAPAPPSLMKLCPFPSPHISCIDLGRRQTADPSTWLAAVDAGGIRSPDICRIAYSYLQSLASPMVIDTHQGQTRMER